MSSKKGTGCTFSNSILLINLTVASSCDLMAVFPGSSLRADLNDKTASVGRRIARYDRPLR
jgi:hypothetical protein